MSCSFIDLSYQYGVIPVGTGRDLSLQYTGNVHAGTGRYPSLKNTTDDLFYCLKHNINCYFLAFRQLHSLSSLKTRWKVINKNAKKWGKVEQSG
jgi:hypothetical protein